MNELDKILEAASLVEIEADNSDKERIIMETIIMSGMFCVATYRNFHKTYKHLFESLIIRGKIVRVPLVFGRFTYKLPDKVL